MLRSISCHFLSQNSRGSYRVLSKVRRIFSDLVVYNFLRNTVGCGCFRHELGVARILEHGIQDSSCIHGVAHRQETGYLFFVRYLGRYVYYGGRLTRGFARYMQCCPFPKPRLFLGLHPERVQYRHDFGIHQPCHASCRHLFIHTIS